MYIERLFENRIKKNIFKKISNSIIRIDLNGESVQSAVLFQNNKFNLSIILLFEFFTRSFFLHFFIF